SHAPEDESTTFNEFDHYIGLLIRKQATLAYWRTNVTTLPKLSLMARDCFAVSVTSTEVEGQFSRSRQVMWPSWRSLHASTVMDIMTYTDHLRRSQREVKRWEGAGMTLVDDLEEAILTVDRPDMNGVPFKWRSQWWEERGHRFSGRL